MISGSNDTTCPYHLPHLCDCGSTETGTSETDSMVQEEFLEMPETKPTDKANDKPADDVDLTPEEEKKFGKFLNKFLEEDDTPSPTPTNTPTPTSAAPSASLDIEGAINRALDAREGKAKTSEELVKLRGEVDALKPKPKKWHQPWTLFSG